MATYCYHSLCIKLNRHLKFKTNIDIIFLYNDCDRDMLPFEYHYLLFLVWCHRISRATRNLMAKPLQMLLSKEDFLRNDFECK